MNRVKNPNFNLICIGKTLLIALIFYTLMEEFYIGPNIGKTLIWMIVYFGVMFLSRNRIVIGKFGKAILCMVAFILCNMFITAITYQISFVAILLDRRWYFYLLLYFVFADYCKEKTCQKYFIAIALWSAIIMSALILGQGYMRSYVNNKWYLNDASFLTVKEWRNGRVRLSLCPYLRVLMFIYSATVLLLKRKDGLTILNIVNLIVTGSALLFFDSTRMIYLIILGCVGIVWLWSIHFKDSKLELLVKIGGICVVLLAVTGGIVTELGVIQKVVNKFAELTAEGSWYARIEAFTYYLDIALKHPLRGIGTISEKSFQQAERMIHGAQGIYFPSDVGLIGTMGVFGFLGGIIYIYMILQIIFNSYQKRRMLEMGLSEAIMLLIIFSLPTLSMLDRPRIFMFPLCFIICEIDLRRGEKND